MNENIALGVMQGAIGLAGLLLVFSGFLLSKAESFETKRGDRYRAIALSGLIPLLAALSCSWIAVWALQGAPWSSLHLLGVLKITLVFTAAYAIIGLWSAA